MIQKQYKVFMGHIAHPAADFAMPDCMTHAMLGFICRLWDIGLLVYKFVLKKYRPSATFVSFDIPSHELLPFVKIKFSELFCVVC